MVVELHIEAQQLLTSSGEGKRMHHNQLAKLNRLGINQGQRLRLGLGWIKKVWLMTSVFIVSVGSIWALENNYTTRLFLAKCQMIKSWINDRSIQRRWSSFLPGRLRISFLEGG